MTETISDTVKYDRNDQRRLLELGLEKNRLEGASIQLELDILDELDPLNDRVGQVREVQAGIKLEIARIEGEVLAIETVISAEKRAPKHAGRPYNRPQRTRREVETFDTKELLQERGYTGVASDAKSVLIDPMLAVNESSTVLKEFSKHEHY